jgi:hypothetical protein
VNFIAGSLKDAAPVAGAIVDNSLRQSEPARPDGRGGKPGLKEKSSFCEQKEAKKLHPFANRQNWPKYSSKNSLSPWGRGLG